MRLAIDLDGVIHNPEDVEPGYKMGKPIKGAVKAMQKLKSEGHLIAIHTVWADTDQKRQAISKWCRYFDIPYDFITNTKVIADLYIDDKGYRFESWEDAQEFIRTLRPET